MKKKISLALQGSGSHGAFTWGVLDKLLESDLFEIDAISTTSSGGLNALALIAGMQQNGQEGARKMIGTLWNAISSIEYTNNTIISPNNINIGQNFEETIENLKNIIAPFQTNTNNHANLECFIKEFFDLQTLRSYNKIKLFLSATNIETSALKFFELHELTAKHILAAGCLPTLFNAVEINGAHYWDGGIVGNPAIFPLIYNADARNIIIVPLMPKVRNGIPKEPHEIANRHNEIASNACLMREMQAINFITDMLDRKIITDPCIKKIKIHTIENEAFFQSLDYESSFYMNDKFLYELYKEGYQTADEWIKHNEHAIQ